MGWSVCQARIPSKLVATFHNLKVHQFKTQCAESATTEEITVTLDQSLPDYLLYAEV